MSTAFISGSILTPASSLKFDFSANIQTSICQFRVSSFDQSVSNPLIPCLALMTSPFRQLEPEIRIDLGCFVSRSAKLHHYYRRSITAQDKAVNLAQDDSPASCGQTSIEQITSAAVEGFSILSDGVARDFISRWLYQTSSSCHTIAQVYHD